MERSRRSNFISQIVINIEKVKTLNRKQGYKANHGLKDIGARLLANSKPVSSLKVDKDVNRLSERIDQTLRAVVTPQTSREVWRDLPGFNGKYQVSDFGRVRKTSLVKQHYVGSAKAVSVDLLSNYSQKRRSVGKLVANAFLPNPFGYKSVVHKNGDKDDNRLSNLKWRRTKR